MQRQRWCGRDGIPRFREYAKRRKAENNLLLEGVRKKSHKKARTRQQTNPSKRPVQEAQSSELSIAFFASLDGLHTCLAVPARDL